MQICVTGASGFLGRAVCRRLEDEHLSYVPLPGRAMGDLRNVSPNLAGATRVIHLAYPGTNGISTSLETPADLVHDVLQIDLNVIRACALANVEKLICVGSVCGYPEQVTFPTGEDQLWNGVPEAVNAAYGHAKRMQHVILHAHRQQYGLRSTQLILGNLYGPGDLSGHVIPATVRKVISAKRANAPSVTVWGDGTATREFLYVDDAAEALVTALLSDADTPTPLNICSGEEISIRKLVMDTMARLNYWGAIQWDPSKPNGQPRRWFSHATATQLLGWTPATPFATGLHHTIDFWMDR